MGLADQKSSVAPNRNDRFHLTQMLENLLEMFKVTNFKGNAEFGSIFRCHMGRNLHNGCHIGADSRTDIGENSSPVLGRHLYFHSIALVLEVVPVDLDPALWIGAEQIGTIRFMYGNAASSGDKPYYGISRDGIAALTDSSQHVVDTVDAYC